MASKMPRTGGKHDGTVESYAKMRGARGKLCKSATSLKTTLFHPECEVFVWRGSPNIPKKIIVPHVVLLELPLAALASRLLRFTGIYSPRDRLV